MVRLSSGLYFLLALFFAVTGNGNVCIAQQPIVREVSSQEPVTLEELDELLVFRSDHFELYTDLAHDPAIEMLDQMELVACNLGVYTGKPLRGKIKAFVVADMTHWPAELLTDKEAREVIPIGSGTTGFEEVPSDFATPMTRPVVYAFADGHNPQRETVHAFCLQTFGRTGNAWFAEGLAEVGAYWQKDGSLRCSPRMAEYLRGDSQTVTLDILSEQSSREAWQTAAHRWGLCFMLSTHPRYCGRFRKFGQEQLLGRTTDFRQTFPELGAQMDADYRAFIDQLVIKENAIASTER